MGATSASYGWPSVYSGPPPLIGRDLSSIQKGRKDIQFTNYSRSDLLSSLLNPKFDTTTKATTISGPNTILSGYSPNAISPLANNNIAPTASVPQVKVPTSSPDPLSGVLSSITAGLKSLGDGFQKYVTNLNPNSVDPTKQTSGTTVTTPTGSSSPTNPADGPTPDASVPYVPTPTVPSTQGGSAGYISSILKSNSGILIGVAVFIIVIVLLGKKR